MGTRVGRAVRHLCGLPQLALFVACAVAGCDDGGQTPISPKRDYQEIDRYSSAAMILAARLGKEPWLDLDLVAEIDEVLERARKAGPVFGSIEPMADFDFETLLVSASGRALEKWRLGEIYVGDKYLDSLATTFFLAAVDTPLILSTWAVLEFKYPLNMPRLAELYKRSPYVLLAENNGYYGDGHRLWGFEKSDAWHIVFSYGGGDCPAGCTERGYSYVEVPNSGDARVVEERPIEGASFPWLPRWNVPERYSVTLFGSVDSLLSAYEHPDWWVRRHAIEATWRLYSSSYAPYGEDIGETWTAMKAELLRRADEVAGRIRSHLDDPDSDVRESAARALSYFGG